VLAVNRSAPRAAGGRSLREVYYIIQVCNIIYKLHRVGDVHAQRNDDTKNTRWNLEFIWSNIVRVYSGSSFIYIIIMRIIAYIYIHTRIMIFGREAPHNILCILYSGPWRVDKGAFCEPQRDPQNQYSHNARSTSRAYIKIILTTIPVTCAPRYRYYTHTHSDIMYFRCACLYIYIYIYRSIRLCGYNTPASVPSQLYAHYSIPSAEIDAAAALQ